MTTTKQKSWTDRVMEKLTGGDKAKMARFESKVEKDYVRDIKNYQEQIQKIDEKIEDAQEELSDYVDNVDVSRINKTESAESYVSVFKQGVREKRNNIKKLELQKEEIQEKIEELKLDYVAIYKVAYEG